MTAEGDVLRDEHTGLRVVRGAAARIIGFGIANLLAAIGSVFLLRYLGVVDFGRYGTVMALMAIVNVLTDAGLTITGSRELALRDAGHDRRDLVRVVLGIRLTLAVAGVAIATAFSAVAGYGSQLVAGTALAGVGVILVAASAALTLPLTVELRNTRLAVLEVIRNGLQVAGVIAGVILSAALVWFFAAQVFAGVGLLLLLPLLVGVRGMVAPRWSLAAWRPVIRAALPIALASVVAVVYFRILVVLASLLATPTETGLFVTSARILEIISGIPLLLTGVALPVVTVAAQENEARLRYILQRMTEMAALLGVLSAVLIALGAGPAIAVLGGPKFADAAPVLRIQGIAMITIYLVQAWVTTLIGLGRQAAITRATLVGLGAVLAAGSILIPPLEAKGAAIATIAADAVFAGAILVALRRVGPGKTLSFAFVPRVVLAGGLALLPALIPGMPDAVATVLALFVFVGAAWVLRLVPGEVRDALPTLGRR